MSDNSTSQGDSTFSVCDAALAGERGPASVEADGEPTPVAVGGPSRADSPDAPWSRPDDGGTVHLDVTDGTTVRVTIEVLPPE